MEEHKWKLGEDMFLEDNMLDQITFDEVALAVRCNCREVTVQNVINTALEIFEIKKEDFLFLLTNNIKEIMKEVNRQKGIE